MFIVAQLLAAMRKNPSRIYTPDLKMARKLARFLWGDQGRVVMDMEYSITVLADGTNLRSNRPIARFYQAQDVTDA